MSQVIHKIIERLKFYTIDADKVDLHNLFTFYSIYHGGVNLMRIFCYYYPRKNATDVDKRILNELIQYLRNDLWTSINFNSHILHSSIEFARIFNYDIKIDCQYNYRVYSRQEIMQNKENRPLMEDRKCILLKPHIRYHSAEIEHISCALQIVKNILFVYEKN